MLKDRRKRRREYLESCQGADMLDEAERRVRAGAAICVQGSVVSLTGLPKPPLLLSFQSKAGAEDWAEQLSVLMGLPVLTKDCSTSGCATLRTPKSPRRPATPGPICPRRPIKQLRSAEESCLGGA